MKKLLIAAAIVAAPAMSFAQSVPAAQAPVTRASVLADLIAVEKAGYHPGRNDDNYPVDIQAAEAKVAAEQGIQPAPVVMPKVQASMHAANTVPRIDRPRSAFYDGA
ncbi:DUF4148 domain-containing protein [Cupriavidus sp. U2]|uniref:DUF4148 domain-containing protein n=1 Tax=Cupriavidus sp. U2 TaxID=2920269 RepID=UPI00129E05AD|nr:DUF4148 domain-containing protein [Cupriavidus sp. U2]